MDWIALITSAYAFGPTETRPRFCPGAAESVLTATEESLQCTLPMELRTLLAQTDGVMQQGLFQGEFIDTWWDVWPAAEIIARNRELRTELAGLGDTRLRAAVFFSSPAVDGIQFGLDCSNGADGKCPVFVWHPIENELDVIAGSLADFLPGWLTGEIKI